MTPARRELEGWVATLKAQLEPAPSNHIGFLVTTMANSLAMRNGQTQQAASRTDGWLLACGSLPADLWTEGCTELLRTKTWMPSPGELMALVGRKFEERRRMLQRATSMLSATADKPKAPIAAPVPQADRLRKLLAEQLNDTTIPEEHRVFNAAHTERSLALFERRAMAPWAAEFFRARMPVEPEPILVRSKAGTAARAVMRETATAMEAAAKWQPGEPVYQRAPEEPPLPDAIPE